jgi:hypothetical protein
MTAEINGALAVGLRLALDHRRDDHDVVARQVAPLGHPHVDSGRLSAKPLSWRSTSCCAVASDTSS